MTAEIPAINALIARSVISLHAGSYDPSVIDEAVRHAYGVDWQLVRDGTYFVAEIDGALAGVGGWSRRETLAGAHGPDDPPAAPLEPGRDAARIRAFYVDPAFARRGVGRRLLGASEAAARRAGFSWAELTSTLPAVPFYSAFGYRHTRGFQMPLPSGRMLLLELMTKHFDSEESIDRPVTSASVRPPG